MIFADLVIVDSGLSKDFSTDENVCGVSITQTGDNNYLISSDFEDTYGHGTAVYSIIKSHNKNISAFIIKAVDEEGINECTLRFVLEYIKDNICCKFINMSLGACYLEDVEDIYTLCQNLLTRGTIIISAFDNSGAISYPAAFDNVIGVITSESCNRSLEFEYYQGSFVNCGADGNNQRVYWKNKDVCIVNGNSFACAHMTGIISNIPAEYQKTLCSVISYLKGHAKHVFSFEASITPSHFSMLGKKACIFPFNKETHSLLRFEKQLSFEIVDVFDSRYSTKIGASTNALLGLSNKKDHIIKSLEEIKYESFDFFILGHFGKIIKKRTQEEELQSIILKCLNAGKKIFSFDCLSHKWPNLFSGNSSMYSPDSNLNSFNTNPFGMLYRIQKPILGVFGTSSQQGKYTLQLILRQFFKDDGYVVGQLGTEPSSPLFEFDECFHYGYNTNIELNGPELIKYVNYLMYRILSKNPDIIIVGAQSGLLPYDFGNINSCATKQINFLIATNPDIVILCVNVTDTTDYISRSIALIESLVDAKVIALVVFPQTFESVENGSISPKIISSHDFLSFKQTLTQLFHRDVFLLGNDHDMKRLYVSILESFK